MEGRGRGGGQAGQGEERRGADRQRPESGGAGWQGHASGGHATGHADIGMEMFLSAHGSKCKTIRVIRCQIQNTTTLQKNVFPKSRLALPKNFIEHLWSKMKNRLWGFKSKYICPGKITEVDIG